MQGKITMGKKFFPNCLLTDNNSTLTSKFKHFTGFVDYENRIEEIHFLDHQLDFKDIPEGKKFHKVIMCNPYHYGIKTKTNAENFENKISNILKPDGELIVVVKNSNPHFNEELFK